MSSAMPNAEDRATADEKYSLALWQSTMGLIKNYLLILAITISTS